MRNNRKNSLLSTVIIDNLFTTGRQRIMYTKLVFFVGDGRCHMQRLLKKGLLETRKVFYLPVESIHPNPAQPRQFFELNGLRELAESIRQYGIIQPLTVRKLRTGYELVAGERRLRAAKMAGLTKVPCLQMGIDDRQSSFLALIENLQRRDLDFFEEAEGYARLIDSFGLSQEEASRRLGKSQSAVANKLRLLRHPPAVVNAIRQNGLTERHARALLRLDSVADRAAALETIIANHYNVSQTEAYITRLLTGDEKEKRNKPIMIIKDIRLLFNTIDRAVTVMQGVGVAASIEKQETDNGYVMTIKIPKKKV
jgi:ParB family chromosome partitioning protein